MCDTITGHRLSAGVQLRLATVQDLPAMLDIYRPYVTDTTVTFEYETPTLAEFTARFLAITATHPWFVAVEAEQVIGYAYAAREFERAAYQWNAEMAIYLADAARGRGIGRALYTLVEDTLRGLGYCAVHAHITGENDGSVAFHRAMGYRQVATLSRVGYKQGRWLDVVWYEKILREKPADPQPVGVFKP